MAVFFQYDQTLKRNYPLIARIRWVAEDIRRFAQSYFVEGDLIWEIGSGYFAARSDSIDRIYSFVPEGVLLDDPDSTKLARHWNAANADTFRRVG